MIVVEQAILKGSSLPPLGEGLGMGALKPIPPQKIFHFHSLLSFQL
jgi:hypothetical protein